MRKILYISGTRADYGLMRSTLLRIKKDPRLNIEIVATGMHLMNGFGRTINDIKKDNLKIHVIKAVYKNDDRESMSNFIGEFTLKLTEKIKYIKPDIILILGDRAEMLGGAIVGAYLMVPIVHIHGGEVSSTVDEIARHAITKLSHIHLAATRKAAERIIKMGEDPWRVRVVGAPGLEDILHKKLISPKDIAEKYNLDLSRAFLLVIQHPVSIDTKQVSEHMRETMEAVKELGYQAIVVYPNADSGGRGMIKVIEKYRKYPFVQIYKNISRREYLSLMNIADVIVGNSSSAIIEAPSFCLPAVNIGARQEGRERAENIIDVSYNKDEIKRAIEKAVYDTVFKKRAEKCKTSYGNGNTSNKIAQALSKLKINNRLLKKRITY